MKLPYLSLMETKDPGHGGRFLKRSKLFIVQGRSVDLGGQGRGSVGALDEQWVGQRIVHRTNISIGVVEDHKA